MKSVVTPLIDTDDLCMRDDESETGHPDDCVDCKKKLRVALLDTLPQPVSSCKFCCS